MHIVICTPISVEPLSTFWEQLTQFKSLADRAGHRTTHFRIDGCSMLEMARSALAGHALRAGADVTFWVDDDMIYDASDALRICEEARTLGGMVGAVACQRKPRGKLNLTLKEPGQTLTFFEGGSLVPVSAVGMGLVAIDASVFHRLDEVLPEIHDLEGGRTRPYFQTMIVDDWWLGEDTSFCRRLAELGIPISVDTRARVGHRGHYTYQLEDSIAEIPRIPSLPIRFE